jgi:hypothetical protein
MEEVSSEKSANQLWKESGTTLSFKNWIEREKQKGMLIPNKLVNDSLASIRASVGIRDYDNQNLQLAETKSNTVLGLNKWVLISSALIIAGAIGYNIYKKRE